MQTQEVPESSPGSALARHRSMEARNARRRTQVTWVRLTASEKERLAEGATKAGLTMSAYARALLVRNIGG